MAPVPTDDAELVGLAIEHYKRTELGETLYVDRRTSGVRRDGFVRVRLADANDVAIAIYAVRPTPRGLAFVAHHGRPS